MNNYTSQFCHLCGNNILREEDFSGEHIPPKQFFPAELRKQLNPNLITIPAHKKCNLSYQKDEDYFISAFGPLTENAAVHDFIMNDIKAKLTRENCQGLYKKIIGEFNSDLWLPNNQVIKKIDKARVERVVWKIVRGLSFYEQNIFLKESIQPKILFYQGFGIDKVTDAYKFTFNGTELRGDYREIFCYRFNSFSFIENHKTFECWSLMFWDSLVSVVTYCTD